MFGGLGNLGNMGQMLKKAMELKGKMEELRAELGELEFRGISSDRAVEVTVNGKMAVLAVDIEPSVLAPDRADEVCLSVQEATNNAISTAQDAVQNKMRELTGGMDVPGLT